MQNSISSVLIYIMTVIIMGISTCQLKLCLPITFYFIQIIFGYNFYGSFRSLTIDCQYLKWMTYYSIIFSWSKAVVWDWTKGLKTKEINLTFRCMKPNPCNHARVTKTVHSIIFAYTVCILKWMIFFYFIIFFLLFS